MSHDEDFDPNNLDIYGTELRDRIAALEGAASRSLALGKSPPPRLDVSNVPSPDQLFAALVERWQELSQRYPEFDTGAPFLSIWVNHMMRQNPEIREVLVGLAKLAPSMTSAVAKALKAFDNSADDDDAPAPRHSGRPNVHAGPRRGDQTTE